MCRIRLVTPTPRTIDRIENQSDVIEGEDKRSVFSRCRHGPRDDRSQLPTGPLVKSCLAPFRGA